jgi:hypothetical protein
MRLSLLYILLAMFLLIGIGSTAPTTLAATSVGTNNITFNAGGSISYPLWFVWGYHVGNEAWITPNLTSGTSYIQHGSPLYSLTQYYYRACDTTGCGADVGVITTSVTPLPTITLGLAITNMSVNGFDIIMISTNAMLPYQWLGAPIGVIFGWIFIAVFFAIWIRTRSVSVVSILGLISSGCLIVSSVGLKLPLPGELIAVSQMILYVTLSACILVLIKK